MLKVGLTGGIGSGKSTVAKIFEVLGIPVYYADDRAKLLMTTSQEIIGGVKVLFGEEAYFADGSLNRAYIGGIVFKDAAKLEQLNALVHPVVLEDGKRWHAEQQGVSYTIKEAALLFEAGSYTALDRIITVTAPQETRIERVMQRDGVDRQAVLDRMNKQWPEEDKVARSHYIIKNYDHYSLIEQVLEIHKELVGFE